MKIAGILAICITFIVLCSFDISKINQKYTDVSQFGQSIYKYKYQYASVPYTIVPLLQLSPCRGEGDCCGAQCIYGAWANCCDQTDCICLEGLGALASQYAGQLGISNPFDITEWEELSPEEIGAVPGLVDDINNQIQPPGCSP